MNVHDTATEVGTSISTTSRVLDNKRNVNPKIRDGAEAVLKGYDYKPSIIAKGMVSEIIRSIAILTVDVRATHYARMIYMIKQGFSSLGYNAPVCNIGDSIQEYNRYSEILSEKQTDGIVPIGSVSNELIKCPEITAEIKNMPIVIASGQVGLPNFHSTLVDDTKAIRIAPDYMSNHGCMDLFYVFDIATNSGRAKRQGFLEAVKLRDVPDGNDRMPEDIAITGCGNSPDSRICEPELATLDNKSELSGGMCASLLRDRTERKKSTTSVAIQPKLMMRGSVSFWGSR